MLPFLKNKEGGTAVTVEKVERKPDDDADYDVLDAVVDDMITAMEKKDRRLLKSALESFIDMIQYIDAEQDEAMLP